MLGVYYSPGGLAWTYDEGYGWGALAVVGARAEARRTGATDGATAGNTGGHDYYKGYRSLIFFIL